MLLSLSVILVFWSSSVTSAFPLHVSVILVSSSPSVILSSSSLCLLVPNTLGLPQLSCFLVHPISSVTSVSHLPTYPQWDLIFHFSYSLPLPSLSSTFVSHSSTFSSLQDVSSTQPLPVPKISQLFHVSWLSRHPVSSTCKISSTLLSSELFILLASYDN